MEESIIQADDRQVFRISPLIRGTLLLLYMALMTPLPVMAGANQGPGHRASFIPPPCWRWPSAWGECCSTGALAQRVEVDAEGFTSALPPDWLVCCRSRWHLAWSEVGALKPRMVTGGIVYSYWPTSRPTCYPCGWWGLIGCCNG
jgi:hypothetical protein